MQASLSIKVSITHDHTLSQKFPSKFFDQAVSAFKGSEWYFAQDGATCHTAEDVINKIHSSPSCFQDKSEDLFNREKKN